MTKERRRIGKFLLAGCCLTMLGVPVYSGHEELPVPVMLRDLDSDANLSTDVPVEGELQIKHTHAHIRAAGTVSNLSLRKVEYKGVSGTQFGIPPEFVANYKVAKDGKASLRAEGLLFIVLPPIL